MTDAIAPQHEPEVLARRNQRIAAQGLPDGWLTEQQTVDLMLPAAIDVAAAFAEHAFLASIGQKPRRAEKAVTSCIVGMFADARQVADFLDAAPAQRRRLDASRAELFDRRLAELRTFAVVSFGHA